MNQRIVNIANELRNHFLDSYLRKNDVSIFLCGGSSDTDESFRYKIGNSVASTKSKYRYSVHYPEEMFIELILGHHKLDLLFLENLLAESVSAVVILVQSPGTFTELGAFSNHFKLNNKLIVVIDPRYQKKQSFIITGPIRYLQKNTTSHVIFQKMDHDNLNELTKQVTSAARMIKMAHPPVINLTNPIACYEFYLALVYTFDPIPRSAILQLAQTLQPDFRDVALTAAETIINGLVNQRDALLVSGNMQVSQKGIETLFSGTRTDIRQTNLQTMLSKFRIDALNVMLRSRRKGVWGKVALS